MEAKNQKGLSRDDICAILKAASEAEVRVLKYGGLYLEFGRKPAPMTDAPAPRQIAVRDGVPVLVEPGEEADPVRVPATEIAEIQQQEARKSKVQEEIRIREAQLEAALIENPALFEELLEAGELEHDGSAAISIDPD